MRTIEEVRADLAYRYEQIKALFADWHTGRHQEFMAVMWYVYDDRLELAALVGSHEQAHEIVKWVYYSVFSCEQEYL